MVHDFFIIIILKSYWVWHNKWIAKRKIVIALNQWINTKLFQLFCFDKIFSSTTKKEKKIYSQEWAECPIALWLEKLNFFCAGAVPPKVCRVLPPLSSSSLHPPLESIMSAGQALWAVQAAVPALRRTALPPSHLVTGQLAAVPQGWIKALQDICKASVNFSEVCFTGPHKPPDRKLTEGCLEHFLSAVYPPTLSQFLSCPQCSLAGCWLATEKVPWLTTFLCSQSWPRGLWL